MKAVGPGDLGRVRPDCFSDVTTTGRASGRDDQDKNDGEYEYLYKANDTFSLLADEASHP